MTEPIYLDCASTTPVDPVVARAMEPFLRVDSGFGNPSSVLHRHGQLARKAVEDARIAVAELLRCSPSEVCFTSGATESNNAAIKGVAWGKSEFGRHIVTASTEHKSVLEPCRTLERQGWEVTLLRPNQSGLIDLAQLKQVIRPDTVLVSIMHVNNETGVIQNVEDIADLVRESNAAMHVDAAQSAGKLPLDLSRSSFDLVSLSAHKIYGPKGVGVLFRRRRPDMRIVPLIEGGGQEDGFRAGTLATQQIVGLGEAARLALSRLATDYSHVTSLREAFLAELAGSVPFLVNGDADHVYPGILSVSFLGIDAFALLNALEDVSASASSACTTGTLEPSHVLRGMGIEGDRLYGAVRFSFGRFSTEVEIRSAGRRVAAEAKRLIDLAA